MNVFMMLFYDVLLQIDKGKNVARTDPSNW